MTKFMLKGYQLPLHCKKNKFTRDELQLELYRQTYEMIKNYKTVPVNSALRKIRLFNLFKYIKEERSKYKTKRYEYKNPKPKEKIKTDIDLKREQWLEAREIGNNFSRMNKFKKNESRQRCDSRKERKCTHKEKYMDKAKDVGNIWSLLNVIKIRLPRKNSRGSQSEELLKKRRSTLEYGTYYSLRNKLLLKDALGEFDNEYQSLLEKCVEFEKDHLNVCGFLEEKLYSSFHSQLNTTYKNSKTQTPQKIENFDIGVQCDMDEENSSPKKEEPPPEIRKSKPQNSDDPVITKIESTSTISSINNNDQTMNLQNYESASKISKIPENFITYSEASVIGQSFEDAVFDVTRKCESEDIDSDKIRLKISDLFLAFGLNLVESVVGRDTIIKHVEMEALKNIAKDQSDNALVPVKKNSLDDKKLCDMFNNKINEVTTYR